MEMLTKVFRNILRSIVLTLAFAGPVCAQANADWTEPFAPHRVIGNVYYVGSRGLASYLITSPQGHILVKSGNTWLRIVLSNLVVGGDRPVSINRALGGAVHSLFSAHRRYFDEQVGFAASDLTADEIDLIRPDLFRHAAARAKGPLRCKVHDAFTMLPGGQPLFPPDASRGAIYVVRNPLDVCVSWAYHGGERDYGRMAAAMADPRHTLEESPHRLAPQLRQRLLSWSDHVRSWTDTTALPVHVMRYEDMRADPIGTFAAAAAFAGVAADTASVERAVAFSSLEELQHQEQTDGFGERPAHDRPFFRQGMIGGWRDALTAAQAARIISDHRDVMRRFGYLTDAGDPVY